MERVDYVKLTVQTDQGLAGYQYKVNAYEEEGLVERVEVGKSTLGEGAMVIVTVRSEDGEEVIVAHPVCLINYYVKRGDYA